MYTYCNDYNQSFILAFGHLKVRKKCLFWTYKMATHNTLNDQMTAQSWVALSSQICLPSHPIDSILYCGRKTLEWAPNRPLSDKNPHTISMHYPRIQLRTAGYLFFYTVCKQLTQSVEQVSWDWLESIAKKDWWGKRNGKMTTKKKKKNLLRWIVTLLGNRRKLMTAVRRFSDWLFWYYC